jgi:energy-converting hydrogenase Eha subunit A
VKPSLKWKLRTAVAAVLAGYRATGKLLDRSMERPFGEASGWHKAWLFPQFVVACGLAPFVGALTGYWSWLWAVPASIVGLTLGFALTASVGRAFARGSFGRDSAGPR